MDKNTASLTSLSKGVAASGPPPVGIDVTPRQSVFGDIGMRIDSDGVWHYRGTPINRRPLVNLFASVLKRDDAGAFWLVTPAEIAPVTVDDAPFMAIDLTVEGSGREQSVRLHTNVDTSVVMSAAHPLKVVEDPATGEPRPYVVLDGGLEAKLSRPVYYDLVALGVEEKRNGDQMFGIWSAGVYHVLGSAGE
ncbi:MAG: DUF1285 domain-containing protein [Rhodospirillaceae bacterium]